MRIAVLITVYNRKEITLHGLKQLEKSVNKSNSSIDIYLTDDNSTDGTKDAVMQQFPSVKIIHGNGKLFWGGGMNLAWHVAVQNKLYDGYIWFNDDTLLYENALNELLFSFKACGRDSIICGAIESSDKTETTYGGKLDNNGELLNPNGDIQEIKYINGNLVYIPHSVFEVLGYIDNRFRHSMGDYDYGLRAQKKGFKLYLTRNYVGICDRHDSNVPICYNKKFPFIKRIKAINYPIGPDLNARFIYTKRHYGIFKACLLGINVIIKTCFPLLYKYNKK